ncbi:MAG: hybrid sensor histidine kinase/response regulator [Gammaproteobacteria bacterium]|nr:hybrid sensor histidine kinase/response regulator [Gammaproteobacteria bacterium]
MSYDIRRRSLPLLPAAAAPHDTQRASADGQDAEDYATTEAMRVFLDSLPGGLGSGLFGVAVMGFILHRVGVREGLAGWVAIQAALLTLAAWPYLRYRAGGDAPENVRRWGRRFVWIAGVTALGWGAAGFRFLPGTPSAELITILGVSTIVIGSIGHMAGHLPVYFAFLIGAELPLAIALLRIGDDAHSAIAIGLGGLMIGLPAFALQANRSLRQSFLLAHRNRALAHALEQRSRDAEQANLAKSRFLAAASHDLRQPVHALGLLLDVLRGQELNPAQAATVEQLARSTAALDGLFDGLLDISRLDAGVVAVEWSAIPLAPLLASLVGELAPEARARELALRLRAQPLTVRSDALLLGRILRNLLANALRYTPRGGVLVACRRRGERVAVEIRDTGIGIAPSEQEAVFDEFYQCGNRERDRSLGLGLGLAIVRRLARLLDIPLELHSHPGRGTRFRLLLPEAAASAPVQAPRVDAPGGTQLAQRFVVVVDDDAMVRVATERLFAGWGCTTAGCGDLAGLQAASANWSRRPDLIVTDLRLPGDADGVAVIEWLREEFNAHVPALIMTGDVVVPAATAEDDRVVLHKPVTPDTLRSAVLGLLAASATERRPC